MPVCRGHELANALYIPRGYTGQLQVLDVGVSHSFKTLHARAVREFRERRFKKRLSIAHNAMCSRACRILKEFPHLAQNMYSMAVQ